MAVQTHIRSSDTIFSAPGTASTLQDIIGKLDVKEEIAVCQETLPGLNVSNFLLLLLQKKSLFLLSDIWSVYTHLISPENNYRILPILKRKKSHRFSFLIF